MGLSDTRARSSVRVSLTRLATPAEIDEASTTAGLHTAGAFNASPHWRATKLVAPKTRR